jgi:hypothetical protein
MSALNTKRGPNSHSAYDLRDPTTQKHGQPKRIELGSF